LIAVVAVVVVVAMAPGVEVVGQLGVVFAISKNVNRLIVIKTQECWSRSCQTFFIR